MGHGGGFYIVEKRHISPGQVPSPVYWFRVEAGITWLTGFLLLVFVYYWTGGVDLLPSEGPALSPAGAIALAVGLLFVGWLVYDRLWISQAAQEKPALFNAISLVLLFGVVYALCKLFTGRAAFIHVGAVIGTNMVFSVWTRIIPAQEEAVAATSAGRERDARLALRARRRALHNTYMTLPVIFTMIAVHAPTAYSHPLNWLILTLLIAVGIAARHMMILTDRRQPARAWLVPGVPLAVALVALGALSLPRAETAPGAAQVPFSVARGIVDLRCASCHAPRPSDKSFAGPPDGMSFARDDEITARAALIKASVATNRTMPPGNKTGMTDEERALLARWADQGASTRGKP
jgi:uncharacterized membrane protein